MTTTKNVSGGGGVVFAVSGDSPSKWERFLRFLGSLKGIIVLVIVMALGYLALKSR